MRQLAILFGGPSVEHEVSLVSARGVSARVDREAFTVHLLGMTKECRWVEGDDAEKMLIGADHGVSDRTLGEILHTRRIDVVFPLIHGTYGEDGILQGYLEISGFPYVGCGVKASAIGMDKAAQKSIWSRLGLPVVPWMALHRETWKETWSEAEGTTDLPVFVKPADSGSSVGITKVTSWTDLEAALEAAFTVSRKVMVERGIEGRELEVAVLGGYEPEIISPPGEIVPGAEFYDYDDKYVNNEAKILVPAHLPEGLIEEARDLAGRAFISIDGYGMARVDFFLEDNEKLYVNEINTIPGFTPISMYPKLIEHTGLSLTNLITKLIDYAMM